MNPHLPSPSMQMAKYSISLLLGICALVLPGKAQNLMYARGMKSKVISGGNVVSTCIKADQAGNTYITGYFSGTADFDPGADTANLTSIGGSDVFIARYDASGRYVFAIHLGGLENDAGNSLAIDGTGNMYITGYFTGKSDFDPGVGTASLTSTGFRDIFVAEYDAAGKYKYAKSIGGGIYNEGKGIAADSTGSVVVTGYFSGTADFDPGAGTANLVSSGFNDAFLARYDPLGNYVYAKKMGGPDQEISNSIALDNKGYSYITGQFSQTVDFDPGTGTANLTSNSGSIDLFIARYDAAGNYVYAVAAGGTSSDVANSIAVDGTGNAYVTGSFVNNALFGQGVDTANLPSAGGNDIFIAKYNSSGKCLYAKAMGGRNTDIGNSIAVDASGVIYVTGFFSLTTDFDPGTGVVNIASTGASDIFVASYDAAGNYLFAKAMGGAYGDQGYGIAVNGTGNLFCCGSFSDTADFDPDAGTAILAIGRPVINAFVSRLTLTGTYVWASQLGNYIPSNQVSEGISVAIDGAGNTYVTGYFNAIVDFDPGADTAFLASAGSNDIFLAKYDASGNYIWAKAIGGNSDDMVSSIAVDTYGNIWITGYFSGTADFDPDSGIVNLTSAGFRDIFIAKYNAGGHLLYAKSIGGASNDEGTGIVADGSAGIYITGYFTGSVDFDPGNGIANLVSAGGQDIFVARYNESAGFISAKAIGGTQDDAANGIALSSTGNVAITGYYGGIVDFDPGPGVATLPTGSMNTFVAWYNSNGNYLHVSGQVTPSNAERGFGKSVAVDRSGNVYFTGTIETYDGTVRVYVIILSKYNSSGTNIYAKRIGYYLSGLAGNSVAVDASGNVYVAGMISGSIPRNFDPQGSSVGISGTDAFFIAYDSSGNYRSGKTLGSLGNDNAGGIALDALGNIYLTGSFSQTVNFDPDGNAAGAFITANASRDIFLAKYGQLSALPVNLTSFTAMPTPDQTAVQVSWRVAAENTADFEVERSPDGQHFTAINKVAGCQACTGEQSYQVTDRNPYPGLSYYRLKLTDQNNKIVYSETVKISFNLHKGKLMVQVLPTITHNAVQLVVRNGANREMAAIR